MAYPVTLNGRTYTLADFEGTNYVNGFPDALEDFVTQAGNIYTTTSTSSVAIGTGSKTFTVADSGKPYIVGTPLRIADSAAPSTNWIDGVVTSYSGTTLVVDAIAYAGSGTKASWNINIGGSAIAYTGTLPIAQGGTGATTAAAARTNLDVYSKSEADGRYINVTGDGMTSDLTFGDNVKATFGAGSDLQIYHTGGGSYVDDTGTGNLLLKTNGAKIALQNDNSGTPYDMLAALTSGAVNLYHAGNLKLATTTSGVDVTGRVYSDGLSIGTTATAEALIVNDSTQDLQARIGSLTPSRNSIVRLQGETSGGAPRYSDIKLDAQNTVFTIMAPSTLAPTIDALNVDSSGNVLVNTTSPATGSTSGSLTVRSNGIDMFLGGGTLARESFSGLTFSGSDILPFFNGSLGNNNVDLGSSSNRFRDLNLAGGVYLGGTGAANKLDDYEEGTWTPAISGVTVTSGTFEGYYTKVGNMVTVWVRMSNATLSGTGSTITGLPFTVDVRSSTSSPGLYYHDNGDKAVYGLAVNNTTQINMQYNRASATWLAAYFTAGSARYVHMSLTYKVA